MERIQDKIRDLVEPQAFDQVGNFAEDPARALAAYRFTDVTSDLLARWLDALENRRMRRAGFGTIGKRGSLDEVLGLLARGDAVVVPFDQHAQRPDGIEVEFFGHPAGTFKSLAIIALSTGAPVLPAAAWREPDGTHVLRFEAALPPVECADPGDAIRRTTRVYNAALERLVLRHPEQWWWVHRRWKPLRSRAKRA